MRISRTGWMVPAVLLVVLGGPVGVAHAVDPGTDLVFALDQLDGLTGFGVAGMVVGEVDEKHNDVRGGFVRRSEAGTVTFGWQLGEPDKIVRKSDKLVVAQSRDVAVYLAVESATPVAVDENAGARVAKCAAKAIFERVPVEPVTQNVPDTGTWKVVCDAGWDQAFGSLSAEARAVLQSVLGGPDFKEKGEGAQADRSSVPSEIDSIPFL